MDYLRTLGSAAVSTLVQKSGLNLPFSLGTKLAQVEGYYTLYDGTKRDDGSPVSVFEYDFGDSTKRNIKPFAQNSLRKLRTTRHPDVLKFMDVVESDSMIYIMTERVRPLSAVLPQYSSKSAQEKEDWLLWGLHRISVALTFLNDQASSIHAKITINSIFLSPSGEWKLGGLELLSNPKDDAAILYTMGSLLPGSSAWSPPEVKKSGWSAAKDSDPAAPDAYALGLLLHAVFNPSYPPPPTAEPPHPPPAPSSRGAIPTSIFPHFKRLLNPNPKGRLTAKGFLEIGMAETGFFFNNRLVKVCAGLDNFALASDSEKSQLLKTLKESASSFPPEFASYKVLPSLISALEHGGASGVTILPLVLQFGNNVSPEEYPKVVLAPIIKLYASPDRGLRMALLEHLPQYVEKLDKKAVSEKIFPHLQLGFSDTVSIIREATVKAIILLAPKLTDRILNNELLRLLAKTQTDPEASIRTNTCILIGRLAPSLGYNTKRKVLVPAFSRALRDPFVHARMAGLTSFMATIDLFEIPELASKVIPNMSFTLVDDEKIVRDQAFKVLQAFVKKLEDHAAQMPETAIVKGPDGAVVSTPMPGTLVDSAAGAAGSLAGWAISTLGKKMDIPIPIGFDRATSAPGASQTSHIGELSRPAFSKPTLSSETLPTLAAGVSKGKSMQLGANKVSNHAALGQLARQLAEEAAAEEAWDMGATEDTSTDLKSGTFGNPWGSEDLIDVNADDDDWSAFESAPTVTVSTPAPIPNLVAFSAANTNTSWLGASNSLPASRPSIQETKIIRAQSPLARPHSAQSTSTKSPPQDSDWETGGTWDAAAENVSSPSTPSYPLSNSVVLSKEDKAAEMARRKEERKQRIAMLKDQKKAAAKI